MKYLHIIPPSKRMMDTYIRMVRKYFDINEHQFYFIRNCTDGDRELFEYGNIIEMSGRNRQEKARHLYNTMKKADHIIWHGFIYHNRILLFLLANPQFLKKSIWIMWGLDIYNWRLPKISLHNRLANFLNYNCRKRMGRVIALVEQDRDCFYSQFSTKIPCDIVNLPMSGDAFALMDCYSNERERSNGKVFIQVAHNAYSFNRHLEVLDALEAYKNENICLYLPMSYGGDFAGGEKDHVKRVKSKLEETFSKKYFCLEKLMPPLEYTKFLWNMDIAIFNAKRQNGLGNILRLLYMGNKVFLPSDGPLYKYFCDNGVKVFDTNSIRDMTYEEFIKKPDNYESRKWIIENYHPDFNYKKWYEFFSKLDACTLNEHPDQMLIKTVVPPMNLRTVYKANRIDVSPYLKLSPTKTKARRLILIGDSIDVCSLQQLIDDINYRNHTWTITGVLDEKEGQLPEDLDGIDVLGEIDSWVFGGEELICTINNPRERKRIVESFLGDKEFCTLVHPTTSINKYSSLGNGCIIYANSMIYDHVIIGSHTIISSAIVERNVHIGEYCNIGHYCIIGSGARIGNQVVIDNNVCVPENAIIADFSHVTQEGIYAY